jgi:hypothetical protein
LYSTATTFTAGSTTFFALGLVAGFFAGALGLVVVFFLAAGFFALQFS